MREFGESVLDILDATAAHDPAGIGVVRLPEGHLVDPIGLAHDPLDEPEGLEHFHRPAGDAVSLAMSKPARLLLDDCGVNLREGGKLRRQRQPSGAGSHDQNINRFR